MISTPRRALPGLLACGAAVCAPMLMGAQRSAAAATPHTVPAALAVTELRVDRARRVVVYPVRAGLVNTANPELNFNGASMGEEELHVPVGWNVEVQFSNVGQATHSMRVLGDADIPVTVGAAAIPGAETPHAVAGMPPGATHVVRFAAARAGRYRLSCAVNAHGYAGMWVRVVVDPRFTTAKLVHHAVADK